MNFIWIYFLSSDTQVLYQQVQNSCYLLLIWSNRHNVISVTEQCWCLNRRQKHGSLWTKLWHMAGEVIHPWGRIVMVYCWPCQLKSNCFWWALWIGTEKKVQVFAKLIAAYCVLDVFICSSKETTSSTTATIEVTTWVGLQKSMSIVQDRSSAQPK